jgi:endonuclease/exonuclease/phosphatase family metal-dependent hydrolase
MSRYLWLIGLWGACSASSTPSIGSHEADLVDLVDSTPLAHLAEAYGLSLTVEDLFDRRRQPTQAPDPTGWQAAIAEDNASRPPVDGGTPLRVLTLNVAILDRPYLFTRVQMPWIPERREAQLQRVFADGWDIILLQELFEWEDTQLFVEAASEGGYEAWPGTPKISERHGTAIFVRSHLIGDTLEQEEVLFDAQRKVERWPGPKIKRGFLTWTFTLAGTSQTLTVVNTHMSAFYDFWHVRDDQARQLGLRIREEEGIVVFGGDVNAAPYYAEDHWVDAANKTHEGFFRNATALPLLAHYGEMMEVFSAFGPPGDVEAAHLVPTGGGPSFAEQPFGDPSYCETEPARSVHTATDCNRVYFESYAGDEPPVRIDHIMVRDPMGQVRVDAVGLAYTEILPEIDVEISDHYGVWADLRIGP